jgi:hypothetical protein
VQVNIQMLIVYYWLTLVAVPLLFLFSVASLDFKDLLEGWISHRWHTEGFEFLRKVRSERESGAGARAKRARREGGRVGERGVGGGNIHTCPAQAAASLVMFPS